MWPIMEVGVAYHGRWGECPFGFLPCFDLFVEDVRTTFVHISPVCSNVKEGQPRTIAGQSVLIAERVTLIAGQGLGTTDSRMGGSDSRTGGGGL